MKINLTRALAGTALVSALAVSAIATECKNFSGFYLGAHVGTGTLNTKTTLTMPGFVTSTSKFAATGMLGGLHVAYRKHFPNHIVLGLEAFGNLSGNKETHARTFKVERKNAFGGLLHLGYAIGNVLPYVGVGLESAGFKFAYTANNLTASKNARRTGVPVVIGVDFLATPHVVLGVQGKQTFYNARTLDISTPAATPNSKAKFQSQATDFTVRASYKW